MDSPLVVVTVLPVASMLEDGKLFVPNAGFVFILPAVSLSSFLPGSGKYMEISA